MMKIDEYYRNVARSSLNGSLLALLPAILIVIGNIVFFHKNIIMFFVIPFFLYSTISFQFYLMRVKQAITVNRNLFKSKVISQTVFGSEDYLLYYIRTVSPKLMIYTPDGNLAGIIKKYREKGWGFSKTFVLIDHHEELLCFYVINGKKIDVYASEKEYLGCLEKSKSPFGKKSKKEILNESGRYIGAVEGSHVFMDEEVIDTNDVQVGRLRRGWMPLEWSSYFLNPNTPVLSLAKELSAKDRLLRMSILIHTFFLERG